MDFGEGDGGEGGEERCEGEVGGGIGVEEVDVYGAPVCCGHFLDGVRGWGRNGAVEQNFCLELSGGWMGECVDFAGFARGCGRNVLRGSLPPPNRPRVTQETLRLCFV